MSKSLTVQEAARALRVSVQTIWRYIKAGTLAGRKVGGKYLIPEEALEALREPQKTEPPLAGGATNV